VRVLFTGASSFTGLWFVRGLAAAGHDVTAIFRQDAHAYGPGVRGERVALASEVCRAVHGVSFGDDRFLALVREGPWDLLAHHAADAANYKSVDFDAVAALRNNTRNVSAVLDALRQGGCRKILLTGSFFEGGEGAGSQGLPDVSPYGLSKALTAQVFRHYARRAELSLGKFVIPNPFGPHEEPRYTAYLVKSWLAGETPSCATPAYVRDNIHVSLLAKVYVRFAEELPPVPGFARVNPSGYAESQGAFTRRVAEEMARRLGRPCPVELKPQLDFPEPRVRINTDVPDSRSLGWSESAAWDDLARYYQETLMR
jgi:nucleoside-diphosphate-sugar epimerase